MIPNAKICWYCANCKTEWKEGKRYDRMKHTCIVGEKNVGSYCREDFTRCKQFQANPEKLQKRLDGVAEEIRALRDERIYLERLLDYENHRRRKGAEYYCGSELKWNPVHKRADRTAPKNGYMPIEAEPKDE